MAKVSTCKKKCGKSCVWWFKDKGKSTCVLQVLENHSGTPPIITIKGKE